MVAIPSVLIFNWLSGRLAKYEAGLAHAGSELVDTLESGRPTAAASSTGKRVEDSGAAPSAPAPRSRPPP